MPSVLGIDLGTTNSAAATIRDGKPVVIPVQGDKFTMPSVVGLLEDKTIIGDRAKRQSVNAPELTVFAAKRLIGASFDDKHTQRAIAGLPYRVVRGDAGDARIKIRDKVYAIQEISALVLGEIKRAAETHLDEPVTQAVITVPAYFNDRQRQATKDAGSIAGLEVLHVVNEPTAAALAYGFHQGAERKIAVYDLGGGTFDVSVLRAGGGAVEVLASSGDDFLGGHDFDSRIAGWLETLVEKEHGVGVGNEPNSRQRLREAAETAKIRLTSDASTKIVLPFLATNEPGRTIHVECEITRETYVGLVDDLVNRTIDTFTETLAAAKLKPKDIDELLLVGGMTASPVVRQRISDFVGCEPATGVHPDLVVAVGAAYQAELLQSADAASVLLDVTPHNLGVLSIADLAETVVPKNTNIPVEVVREFTTMRDDQETVRIVVFQGDSRNIDENQILGEFFLEGIRPAPRGDVRIDVRFGISPDGTVHVSATDKETGKVQSVRIEAATALSQEQIRQMAATHQEILPPLPD